VIAAFAAFAAFNSSLILTIHVKRRPDLRHFADNRLHLGC
jgi:hypothetical protein